jgi:sporulation protein YlmC with PRC-barrel domain
VSKFSKPEDRLMTSKRLFRAAIVPLVGLVGWTALANAQEKPPPKSSPEIPTTAARPEIKRETPFCHKATDVIGARVQDPRGEGLGRVEELVIEPASGSIDYAVISFGEGLGTGDKLFAVPFSLLKAPAVPAGGRLAQFTLDVDKSRLEKAPGFEKRNWPDISLPAWAQEVDRFYDAPRARPAGSVGKEVTSPPRGQANPDVVIEGNRPSRLCKATELIHKDVQNPQNERLGEIHELVLDHARGRVNYLVLQSGGFLGVGDKLLAVPWQEIRCDRQDEKDRLLLGVGAERLEAAPEFDEKDWNKMSDPAWIEEMYAHYGTRPYWASTPTIEK